MDGFSQKFQDRSVMGQLTFGAAQNHHLHLGFFSKIIHHSQLGVIGTFLHTTSQITL